ncbi:Phosphotransferase enzyme family protein [Paenibacillus sp. yr247]|uniref:phosphotransferase family protein n=1 Tax=Paenibacillus sp. yr247 TaxID=1761880 RepID=UPI000882DC32|nr:aminoglycoside phosphotransferase family protein [Paenibacillus sp. yr247]SDO49768.1 Phosphotransferase enzyme family protein [Paenibacillus sp. yr247]
MKGLLDAALLLLNIDKNDIEILGEGFGSIVIEQNDGSIFRIAKTMETAQQYTKEFQMLPQIRTFLDIEIPLPISYMFDPSINPSGIMRYKKLKGTPLNPDLLISKNLTIIAKQLAEFIIKLHQIPISTLDSSCPQESNNKSLIQILRKDTKELLTQVLTVKEQQKLAKWWEETLEDSTFFSHRFVLCHGDLWYENILVDDLCSRITGIIDFSDMTIGDPAKDLATQVYMGEDFYNLILSEYKHSFPEDTTIERRVKKHQGLRELGGLLYAIKHDNSEIEDSISKIRTVIF